MIHGGVNGYFWIQKTLTAFIVLNPINMTSRHLSVFLSIWYVFFLLISKAVTNDCNNLFHIHSPFISISEHTKKTYMLFCEHLYVTNFFYFDIFVMWHTMAIQKYKYKLFHITYIKFTRLCLIAKSINCWMPDNPDLFEQKFALSNWFVTFFLFLFLWFYCCLLVMLN